MLYEYQLVGAREVFYTGPNTSFSNVCDGYGLRVLDGSEDVLVYGAGLYSFFVNNNVTCAGGGTGPDCQDSISSVEGGCEVSVYCLNTVGVKNMVTLEGQRIADALDNVAGFTNTIALFRTL